MKEEIKELIEEIEDNKFLEIVYNLIKKRTKK